LLWHLWLFTKNFYYNVHNGLTPDQSHHISVQYTVQPIISFQYSFLTLLLYAYFTSIRPSTHIAHFIALNLKTVTFRCAILVVLLHTYQYRKQATTHLLLVFIFKLTTCFGLFVRPSSGHKIYVVRGSYKRKFYNQMYDTNFQQYLVGVHTDIWLYNLRCVASSNDIYFMTWRWPDK